MTQAEHATASSPTTWLDRHRDTLDGALRAIEQRGWWEAYPESARKYGEDGQATGRAAFEARLGRPFELDQPGTDGEVAGERSPYGIALDVRYPHCDPDALISAAGEALPAWRDAGPDARTGVVLEILARLNARSHELAHAVMHTSGQAYAMAFQAGAPHAQDRALEAVAQAYAEMTRHGAEADWIKPQGKRPALRMRKAYTVAPRGIALAIGCRTFPTWNTYPGLFASLVCGNPVLVKPHPAAVLPLAITVAVARETLREAGFSPDLVALAAEQPDEKLAATLAVRGEIKLIDYTGSSAFGNWLAANATQATLFSEQAGVNPVVVHSTDDYRGMLANLAFTLSLYSGQMCTTTQNVFVPRDGIDTPDGRRTFDELAADLGKALGGLLGDDARATAILGAIADSATLERLDSAGSLPQVVVESKAIAHADFPEANVRTPLVAALDAADEDTYLREWFGPIAFLIAVDDADAAVERLGTTVRTHGAITAGVYSTDERVLAAAAAAALDAGVALSENLTGGVYVNQSTAYSDYHATGLNPAANAALSDTAYVAPRFHLVQRRWHLPAEEEAA